MFTSISHQAHTDFTSFSYIDIVKKNETGFRGKGGIFMKFLSMEWYWWLLIAAVLVISVPLKIRFMKWWSRRQQEKKDNECGKWGGEE